MAALLTAVGLFGLLSYSVSKRTREIGIRMALGARPLDALGATLGDALVYVGLGLAAGLGLALSITHLLESLLYGVEPRTRSPLLARVPWRLQRRSWPRSLRPGAPHPSRRLWRCAMSNDSRSTLRHQCSSTLT